MLKDIVQWEASCSMTLESSMPLLVHLRRIGGVGFMIADHCQQGEVWRVFFQWHRLKSIDVLKPALVNKFSTRAINGGTGAIEVTLKEAEEILDAWEKKFQDELEQTPGRVFLSKWERIGEIKALVRNSRIYKK